MRQRVGFSLPFIQLKKGEIKMPIERVYKGNSISEVVEILGQYEKDAKLIAGGTDIIIDIRNEKIKPKVLIDISSIEELRKIEENEDYIEIGGAVTFTQIVESEIFTNNLYGLNKASRLVGSPQIRNKGTIGGNIANGSAAADSVPPLICLDSTLIIESINGIREIKLEDYYKDHIKIRENELITKIRFKKPKENQILSFSKLGLRKALSISRLTISILLELDEEEKIKNIKVSSGALARYPMRELEVEEFFLGKTLDEENINAGIIVLQKSMDKRLEGRPTLPYKRVAVERMLREALYQGANFLNKAVEV